MGLLNGMGGRGVAKKVWDPFLETPDNFPGPVSIFSSSFIYQLMANIGPNLAIMLHENIKIKI